MSRRPDPPVRAPTPPPEPPAAPEPERPQFAPLPHAQQERLRRIMAVKGIGNGAKFCGMNPVTFQRCAFGFAVSRGTEAQVAEVIAKRDKEGKVP